VYLQLPARKARRPRWYPRYVQCRQRETWQIDQEVQNPQGFLNLDIVIRVAVQMETDAYDRLLLQPLYRDSLLRNLVATVRLWGLESHHPPLDKGSCGNSGGRGSCRARTASS